MRYGVRRDMTDFGCGVVWCSDGVRIGRRGRKWVVCANNREEEGCF